MKISIAGVQYAVMCIAAFTMISCSSNNAARNFIKENEYRMMLQQQKQNHLDADLKELEKKIPEMTAQDFEKLGDEYLRQGNLNMAFIQYGKALHSEPGSAALRYKTALLFLKKGLPGEAEAAFRKVLDLDPGNAPAYLGIGQAALIKGAIDSAEDNFRQAVKLDPGLWQAYNFLGVVLDRKRDFGEAAQNYTTAIAIQPDRGVLYNNLGMSYYLNGDYDKAVRAFDEALKRSDNKKIYNNMALALSRLGKDHEAFDNFKKAGGEASAYNNLGFLYLIDGENEKAAHMLEKAIEISPRFYVRAHENLKKTEEMSSRLLNSQ